KATTRSACKSILDDDSLNPEALYLLGALACDEKRPGDAVDILQRAIRAAGDRALYHYKLGVALQAQGNAEAAQASYRRAIELDADFAPAHQNLGALLHVEGRLDAAIESYMKAIELQPHLSEAVRNLAYACLQNGDAAGSERYAR